MGIINSLRNIVLSIVVFLSSVFFTYAEDISDEFKLGQLIQVELIKDDINKTIDIIKKYHIGSIIFYRQTNLKELIDLLNKLQEISLNNTGIPLLYAADFETGVAYNVKECATVFPHQMGVAATGSVSLAENIAKATAQESKSMGVYWNYSPIADVNTNPNNPVIGVRSFSDDPNIVSNFVKAYILGYQSTDIIATAKHFPGHGNTDVDSHLNLPVINVDFNTLRNIYLKPFETAINSNVRSIMTAHIIVNAVDDTRPAIFSEKILTDLLKKDMGYKGLVITDALNMDAIDEYYNINKVAINALEAGANVLMATGSYEEQIQVLDGLFTALKNNKIDRNLLNDSYNRIVKLKKNVGLFDNPTINYNEALKNCSSEKHKILSQEAFEKSLTTLVNNNTFPLKKQTTLYIAGQYGAKELSQSFYKEGFKVYYTTMPNINNFTEGEINRLISSIDKYLIESDYFIFTTFSSEKPPLHKNQVLYANLLKQYNKPLIVISLGLPYDIASLDFSDAFIATYALNRFIEPVTVNKMLYDVLVNAIKDLLIGKIKATGKLPVDIPGTMYKRGYNIYN